MMNRHVVSSALAVLLLPGLYFWNSNYFVRFLESAEYAFNFSHLGWREGHILDSSEIVFDCKNCPEMVTIRRGTFIMGAPPIPELKKWFSDSRPQHEVTVPSFAIGRTEVTVEQWNACVVAGHCARISVDDRGNLIDPAQMQHDLPMTYVSWHDAQDYAEWLSNKTGYTYRLPSEAEWEYAARAGTRTAYWWGEDENSTKQCAYENGQDRTYGTLMTGDIVAACSDSYENAAPVGSYQANQFGLFDMAGNVREWVEDVWNSNYRDAPVDGTAWQKRIHFPGWMKDSEVRRVSRGGNYFSSVQFLRSSYRTAIDPNTRATGMGFRVAKILSIAPRTPSKD